MLREGIEGAVASIAARWDVWIGEIRGLVVREEGLTNAAHFVVGSVGAVDDGQLHQLLALQFVHSLGLKKTMRF